MIGRVVKSLGGFYYVECEQGIIQTRARGILRRDKMNPVVGDMVDIEVFPGDEEEGVLNKVLGRKNLFARPPVSNVDLMIIMFSAVSPEPNFDVIDKFLIMAESKDCQVVLCMNKTDTASEEVCEAVRQRYAGSYDIHFISCRTGMGIDEILRSTEDKTVALAGPSGVGKSTLAGIMIPDAEIETGDISRKTGRGKHTTRHVELFHTPGGGLLFDTPGFTSLDLEDIEPEELDSYYPEIRGHIGKCRFHNCLHDREPGCAVKEAVDSGLINKDRYDSYITNLQDLISRRKY